MEIKDNHINEISSDKNCSSCSLCKDNYCIRYKTPLQVYFNANDCKFYNTQSIKHVNKGIEIRNRKQAKHNKKVRQVKNGQENICRFIYVEYISFHRINGKMKKIGAVKDIGLQISNKVYFNNGKFKFINNKNLKIKKTFYCIPNEFHISDFLIEKYNNFFIATSVEK